MLDTSINIVSLLIGIISLVIALVAQKQAAEVKQSMEIMYEEIKASNQLIINSAREDNRPAQDRVHFILGVAESQKNLINGMRLVSKFRRWNLWDKSDDAKK